MNIKFHIFFGLCAVGKFRGRLIPREIISLPHLAQANLPNERIRPIRKRYNSRNNLLGAGHMTGELVLSQQAYMAQINYFELILEA